MAASLASSKTPERLDTEKLKGEKVEGVNTLSREWLRMYDIYMYLLPLHNKSLHPIGDDSLSCTMLNNKKQMLWSQVY